MNAVHTGSFWDLDFHSEDLIETASNAIFSSRGFNTTQLQGLLQQGLVDATTETAEGGALLMLAVKLDKSQAFEDLLKDLPEHRRQAFNRQDKAGDTVLHHLARHRMHGDFAPGAQAGQEPSRCHPEGVQRQVHSTLTADKTARTS